MNIVQSILWAIILKEEKYTIYKVYFFYQEPEDKPLFQVVV